MSDPIRFPTERARPHGFRSKLNGGDELATIGNPELIHANALIELRSAALRLAAIKPGEPGEYEAIHEIMKAFRGPDWEAMVFWVQDDGA